MNWKAHQRKAGLANVSESRDVNGWEALFVQSVPQGGYSANFSPMTRHPGLSAIIANEFRAFNHGALR